MKIRLFFLLALFSIAISGCGMKAPIPAELLINI
jgi:predicted small lipoprotein YifL